MKSHAIRSWVVKLLAALAVLALIYAGVMGWQAYQLYQTLKALKALPAAMQNNQMPVEQARLAVDDGLSRIKFLRVGLGPALPVFDLLGGTPGQARPLLDYGYNALTAADLLLKTFEPAWEGLKAGYEKPAPLLVRTLASHQEEIDAAAQALNRAVEARRQVRLEQVPAFLSDDLAMADEFLPLAQSGAGLMENLAYLAGAGEERTYLLAAQNSDELRATGGFLSSVGLLKIKDGDILSMNLNDSYQIDNPAADYPEAPKPLAEFMLAGMWVFRDANWSPDFPTSARKMEELYQLSVGGAVDGVIVFDQAAVQMMLAALGPVRLETSSEVIDQNNVIGWMHDSWAPEPGKTMDEAWWARRKTFMPLLAKSMIAKLTETRDPQGLKQVFGQALEIAKQGHLLVYVHQPEAQAALGDLGFDGAVTPGPGDYLYLVDSNVGWNKVDASIERAVAYAVDLSAPASPQADLKVTYTHRGQAAVKCAHEAYYDPTYEEMTRRCYWDYWRVLAPTGSQLAGSNAQPVPADLLISKKGWDGTVGQEIAEGNTTQFSGLLVLGAASKSTLELSWALPPSVVKAEEGGKIRYLLKVPKQPGVRSIALRVQVTVPGGYTLTGSPAGWKPGEQTGTWVWANTISQVAAFDLVFAPAAP